MRCCQEASRRGPSVEVVTERSTTEKRLVTFPSPRAKVRMSAWTRSPSEAAMEGLVCLSKPRALALFPPRPPDRLLDPKPVVDVAGEHEEEVGKAV